MGTVNQEEQLKRIADALERIADNTKDLAGMELSLFQLKEILAAVRVKNTYGDSIAITGGVTTL